MALERRRGMSEGGQGAARGSGARHIPGFIFDEATNRYYRGGRASLAAPAMGTRASPACIEERARQRCFAEMIAERTRVCLHSVSLSPRTLLFEAAKGSQRPPATRTAPVLLSMSLGSDRSRRSGSHAAGGGWPPVAVHVCDHKMIPWRGPRGPSAFAIGAGGGSLLHLTWPSGGIRHGAEASSGAIIEKPLGLVGEGSRGPVPSGAFATHLTAASATMAISMQSAIGGLDDSETGWTLLASLAVAGDGEHEECTARIAARAPFPFTLGEVCPSGERGHLCHGAALWRFSMASDRGAHAGEEAFCELALVEESRGAIRAHCFTDGDVVSSFAIAQGDGHCTAFADDRAAFTFALPTGRAARRMWASSPSCATIYVASHHGELYMFDRRWPLQPTAVIDGASRTRAPQSASLHMPRMDFAMATEDDGTATKVWGAYPATPVCLFWDVRRPTVVDTRYDLGEAFVISSLFADPSPPTAGGGRHEEPSPSCHLAIRQAPLAR